MDSEERKHSWWEKQNKQSLKGRSNHDMFKGIEKTLALLRQMLHTHLEIMEL